MVTCEYHGRTGNNIFQYIFARVIASLNGLHMGTEWNNPDFIKFTKPAGGEKYDRPVVACNDLYYDEHDFDWYSVSMRKMRVKTDGFFQNPKYYDCQRDLIKDFFILPGIECRPAGDIVMHVRLTDYADKGLRSVISPQWYGKILYNMNFNHKKNKLFIVTDEPANPYFKQFVCFQPKIISNSPKEDFLFIRNFDTILCGNSSFSWWASWLSNAKKIYTFAKWIREPHGQIIRLAFMDRATPVQGEWLER